MILGTRIQITELEGTVVEIRGRFIGIQIDGFSSMHYMTPETFESRKYMTPVSSPQKVLECPPAPKKAYPDRIKSRTGSLSPKKLVF
jgi:hypothetical protein